ncbi:MAG: bifunctional folylpolyglutamate synthase/dihydrofolate synthase [Firmicutes bacterium]|nr:bifunctional folylpolyglutamate synthase/dihydrofolate synthase [Bacillota bacterium]
MDAIERIHTFDRFGSILGLERMNLLLERLGNPERDLKVIHVAGTNGKGSVCRYLYEALQENGYKVGLYTSPFIESFYERIQADGSFISKEELEQYTGIVVRNTSILVREGHDSPTEFEVVTAIAFLYFAAKKVDFVILEVGLGGTGDSTNVIEKPLASVITSISYDHMQQLGNTLEAIAGEKAGIIKQGVPVVSNVSQREAAAVIARTAYEKGCVLYDASKVKYRIAEQSAEGSCFDMQLYGTDYSGVEISMPGRHQIENAKTALIALEVLRKQGIINIKRDKLYEGMRKAKQPGRFEVYPGQPCIVLDGAHNEAGAETLKETMGACFPGRRILIVAGMLADKETDKIAGTLAEISKNFIAAEPDNPRKLPAEDLAELLSRCGGECAVAKDGQSAIQMAMEHEIEPEVILFAGSLYLIGEIRGRLNHV